MAVAERDLEQLEREISTPVQQELLLHPGKWAAITRTAVLAIGDDPEDVVEAARQQGVPEPILYRIPDAATLYFY
jgi:hypothetical protein